MEQEQLLALVKQLADSYLKQRAKIEDLTGRLARLEHVATVSPMYGPIASPSQSVLYAQRDIIGE